MRKIGFDNDQYVRLQSERIRQRISKFGGKLYLEFGGKLFDDFHASRVLPGFQPDSKIRMLMEMKAESEIIVAISADDIERNKRRGDLGITYDMEALRLIDAFRACGLYVGGVCITHCREQGAVSQFQKRLEALNVPVYRHYLIPDYPANLPLIVSPDGFGKSDFIETTRPLVVVTAPGPGSGKMATCLSQLYHHHQRGERAGAKRRVLFPGAVFFHPLVRDAREGLPLALKPEFPIIIGDGKTEHLTVCVLGCNQREPPTRKECIIGRNGEPDVVEQRTVKIPQDPIVFFQAHDASPRGNPPTL